MNQAQSEFEILPDDRGVHDYEFETETGVVNWHTQMNGLPDPTSDQMMRAAEISGALDFWDRPDEDVYSPDDGEPA